jgi:hypothetical protein
MVAEREENWLNQIMTGVGIPIGSSLRISADARFDARPLDWQDLGSAVQWTHPSGCLTLGAGGRWGRDRPYPDIVLTVDARVVP